MKKYFIFLLATSTLLASQLPFILNPEYFNTCVPVKEEMRKDSLPLISGDSFRAFCDHKIDETNQAFYPESVVKGDIIYVTPLGLKVFFETVHPKISEPYLLLTHNSDDSFPEGYEEYLSDEKLKYWFTTNNSLPNHPKMVSIPIGIANAYWSHGDKATFLQAMKGQSEKKHLLIMNFQIHTNIQKRAPIFEYFKMKDFCYSPPMKDLRPYLEDVKASYFVLSPLGNGLDCHRTWEALLLGTIPVIESTTLDSMFEDLPVVIVDDLKKVDTTFLMEKLEELSTQEFIIEKTFMSYWKAVIDQKKNEVINR